MQVCFVYVRLVGGSTNLLGLSPDIDLVGLRIITLVIIRLSLMNSFDLLIVQSSECPGFEGSSGRELSRW